MMKTKNVNKETQGKSVNAIKEVKCTSVNDGIDQCTTVDSCLNDYNAECRKNPIHEDELLSVDSDGVVDNHDIAPVHIVVHESCCELIMYPPQQLHQPKRRKKRPIHGLKTVEVSRGKTGYGFTISGQHPCVLSNIVSSSPADRVGLRPGDYLMSVNGLDVSKHCHDDVVCMVGTSTGTLTIQVAENYNSSDSSDDDFYHRTKAKYTHRSRKGARAEKAYNEKMEKLLADINQRDRPSPDGTSHDPNSRPLLSGDNRNATSKARSSRPRLHTPVGAENHELQAEGTSYIEAGASNVFKVPFQKSVSASNVPTAPSLPLHRRVEPKQAFIKSTSQGHVNPPKSVPAHHSYPSRTHPSHVARSHMYDQFSPNSLQQIINHSLHSYSAANEAFILNEEEGEDEEGPVAPEGQEVRIVVGYIGSLEMPGNANQPHVRIQSIRNAVRRLRVEQKIHTLVLMVVTPDQGVKLINIAGKQIAYYPVERLAFSGVCPDDRRFFGIVTLRAEFDDSSSDSDSREEMYGSSCHVFMVDQELSAHNIHAIKALSFGIQCTVDKATQRCVEFPRSTTPIILSISNLYKDRPSGSVEKDMERSQVFANPNRPIEHVRTSSSSSNNSNSDSGLGLFREDNRPIRGASVSPEVPPPPLPARTRPPPPHPPQLPQVKWSGNTMYLTDGPIKHAKSSSSSVDTTPKSSKATGSNDTSTSSEEFNKPDKLNVRALPNKSPAKNRFPGDDLDDLHAAETLRMSMQKLLQARQRNANLDHTSSDTESRSSKSDLARSASDLGERPVSAPFKYLSKEPQTDTKTVKSSYNHVKHDSDSSLADKLSPRAFLSSGYSPDSKGSAFKKIKSRTALLESRSPSAPPMGSYHGDDEASDEEAVSSIIKRFQKDQALGLTTDSIELLKGEHFTSIRKRDQERQGVAPSGSPGSGLKPSLSPDGWSKGQSSTLSGRQKSNRRNPLSLSHESLVILDQDFTPSKLTSASSVNSIVSHVAKETEQQEVGRVASWAVNFDKLLNDHVGIAVFKEFLKKEFSEENIEFWQTCEDFKNIADASFRTVKAKEIYGKHVAMHSPDPVNIDSVLRREIESRLEKPSHQLFNAAQLHIYQLMKQDSYGRFLKSDLYKSYVMTEMEGRPLQVPGPAPDPLDRGQEDKKKGHKGSKENEESKEKRRHSLLPWSRLSKLIESKKTSKGDNETKTQKSSKETKDANMNNLPLTSNAPTTIETVASKRDQAQIELPDTIEEEPEQPRFCRVIMPDGSTTVVGTKQGQTISYILGKLCEKRGLSIASVDVFLLGSDKPLNLTEDISLLGSKEVTIEERVLFRMDLPNKKCIGVKAKPNRLIKDVFKPILNKYGYRMETIDIHLNGQSDSLCLDNLVSTIDSQRVIVLAQAPEQGAQRCAETKLHVTFKRPPQPNKFTSKLGFHGYSTNNNNNPLFNNHNQDTSGPTSLDDITNNIFDRLMQDKSDQLLANYFDDLGILDFDNKSPKVVIAELGPGSVSARLQDVGEQVKGTVREKWKKAREKLSVKNTHQRQPSSSGMCESCGIDAAALSQTPKRVPDGNVHAPHGLLSPTLEPQELLRTSMDDLTLKASREKTVSPSTRDGKHKKSSSRDLMSEIDDYIESINENFAAYTRDSVKTPKKNEAKAVVGTPKSAIKSTDKSSSQDEADSFFGSFPEKGDFSDPQMTEKSLKDIGFSNSHNKYLSKSRNFVNQRTKAQFVKPESVHMSSDISDWFSTVPQAFNQSFLFDSPQSSPYSSDSSLDRENKSRHVSRPRTNVPGHSRHTQLHSPVTGSSEDSFLSTVDTDGHALHHSTPTPLSKSMVSSSAMSSTKLDSSLDVRNSILGFSHTDEVTFV
ncbi:uncharacterized protein LOC127865158 isoform X8 [Dreissena polymorpha]|uniref:uncharacterized protein LOC127865158 isoform X8 n=1 Tax=Dreissena polymorpha TaxID=45954 RepID=UPI002264DE12|nr:uncharacterized protein LOC127865158 isoform X8 [Dreissena polymorpha]